MAPTPDNSRRFRTFPDNAGQISLVELVPNFFRVWSESTLHLCQLYPLLIWSHRESQTSGVEVVRSRSRPDLDWVKTRPESSGINSPDRYRARAHFQIRFKARISSRANVGSILRSVWFWHQLQHIGMGSVKVPGSIWILNLFFFMSLDQSGHQLNIPKLILGSPVLGPT